MSDDYKKLAKLFDNTPRVCEKCNGLYEYDGAGEYVCRKCGNIAYDDYGRVRKYVEENGPAPYHVIKEATGVSGALVREYLDTPNDSARFNQKCRSCGCLISSGTLCTNCMEKANSSFASNNSKPKPEPTTKKSSPPKSKGSGVHFVVDRKR